MRLFAQWKDTFCTDKFFEHSADVLVVISFVKLYWIIEVKADKKR
jgi:hypothetical protein